MPMTRLRMLAALVTFICSVSAARAGIDGSVFLFPIAQGGGFASPGEAVYVNALQQVDPTVPLGGSHSVHGSEIFTHEVTGKGRYSYVLEGPATPGSCYGTTLEVTAEPEYPATRQKATFNGTTKCAPLRPCVDANNNGVCDNQEPVVKDPNQDSCPGGAP